RWYWAETVRDPALPAPGHEPIPDRDDCAPPRHPRAGKRADGRHESGRSRLVGRNSEGIRGRPWDEIHCDSIEAEELAQGAVVFHVRMVGGGVEAQVVNHLDAEIA